MSDDDNDRIGQCYYGLGICLQTQASVTRFIQIISGFYKNISRSVHNTFTSITKSGHRFAQAEKEELEEPIDPRVQYFLDTPLSERDPFIFVCPSICHLIFLAIFIVI